MALISGVLQSSPLGDTSQPAANTDVRVLVMLAVTGRGV